MGDLNREKVQSLIVMTLVSLTVFAWLRFAILSAGLLVHPGALMGGEGVLTYEVGALASGELYPDVGQPPYAITSTPPVYHYLVAVVGLVMPFRIAGRFISLFAAVAIALLISSIILEAILWNRRGPRTRTQWNVAWAAFCGACCLSLFPFSQWAVYAQGDVLGLAFSLFGVLGWLRGMRGVPGWLAYGSVGFLLGSFTRPEFVVYPLVCAGAWMLTDWRAGLRFLSGWLGSALLMVVALSFATDGGFWTHMWLYPGSWGVDEHVAQVLGYLMGPMGWLCALGTCGAFWPYYCGRREAVAYGFPALCLVGWGLIFAGRIDAVSFNCSLSLLAILWIGLGSWLDEFGWYLEGNSYQGSRWLVAAVIGASLLGSLVQLVTQPIDPRFYVNRYAAAEEYRHVVQEVLRTKAPVLAQDIGPVLDAGLKPEVVNLRALSRLSQQGVADAAAGAGAVVERLNNGGYGLVVLVDSIDDAEETALSPAMKVALLANYRVWSRTGYSVLYRPIDELSP